MDEENTEGVTSPTTPDRAAEVAQVIGRPDDRNEELEQSPIPDPEDKDTGAGDDPSAD